MRQNTSQQFSLKRFFDEIFSRDFTERVKRHSSELQSFYLSEPQLHELAAMNTVRRMFVLLFWILRALFYKLTLWRRVLFVAGIIFMLNIKFDNTNIHGNALLGMTAFILIILLELKDKLLAHDELAEGRKIQQALMPDANPHMEGYSLWLYTRSANEVCGDLIDVLSLDSRRKSFVLADVAGKGLHAALLTAKLQATIRALAYEETSLSSLIHRVNTIFFRDSPANLFASLLYFEIHSASNIIQFVNAGHLPPVVVRAGIPEESSKGDPAIGLARSIDYVQRTVTLNSHDILFAYSDGVTDAKNIRGEFFGKERLMQFLSKNKRDEAEQIGLALITELDRFMSTERQTDDISLIIIQRQ
ncbi:MAG: serine/threonine-protein phosphatase [Bacteroidetes bacterium]|nr:serine/threonine-protein phosphatase [Bacteroidota bacterium]